LNTDRRIIEERIPKAGSWNVT